MQKLRDATHLLRGARDFRYLLAAQFLAQAADGLAQAAFFGRLLLDPLSGGTPERILSLFALTLLPYSLIAPHLGVFVDRWSRRRVLLWTNLGRSVLLVTLPLWAAVSPGDTELYAGILLLLGLGRLFLTTKGAVLPVVLGEHHLLRGNAISAGGGMLAALAGGALGLAALSFLGASVVFVIAGGVYAAAAGAALRISSPLAHEHAAAHGLKEAFFDVERDLVAGFREIWRRARARVPLIAIFLLRTLVIFIAIAAILTVRNEYPGLPARLSASGLALGAAGSGSLVAALTTPALGRRFSEPALILLGFALAGAGTVLLGGVPRLSGILALMLIGGYGSFLVKVAVDAQVQEALPDGHRGRGFSLYDILYNVASVVAAGVMVVFQSSQTSTLVLSAGGVTILLTGALSLAMQRAGLFSSPTPVS